MLGKKMTAHFGEELSGKHIAVWSLAFTPNTDDMRDPPARVLVRTLVVRGATVAAYDPVATEEAKRVIALDIADSHEGFAQVRYCENAMDAVASADVPAIVTEWKWFRSPGFELKRRMKSSVIFDGRNLFEPEAMQRSGFEYYGIGRSARG